MTDHISKIFDMQPQPTPQNLIVQPQKPTIDTVESSVLKSEKELHDDYLSSMEDYTTLMDQGKAALTEILTIATASQNARFFEAAALMIKTLADTNSGRMDVHQKLHQIKKLKQELGLEIGKTTIEKAIFVGSTSDLLKQIKPRIIDVDQDEKEIKFEEEVM